MPIAVKNLYMAKTLEELNKKCTIPSLPVKKENKTTQLISSATKLFKSAQDVLSYEEKDEELAYLYLFRAMELWNMVIDSNEFKADKKYFHLMHGKEMQTTIQLLEEYSKKLERRYADLQNGTIIKGNDVGVHFKIAPSLVSKKRKEAKDVTVNGIDNLVVITDKPENADQTNDSYYLGEKKCIQCDELREQILSNSRVLIVDIRPKKDFESSHITKVNCINIPDTSIIPGLSANKLGAMIINSNEKFYWNQRDQYQQLVLMDWNSEEKDVIPGSPLSNLQNIFLKWDPDVIYKNRPLILNGGYEHWLDTYPTLTTNPQIVRPPKPVTSPYQFIHLRDHNIEYPLSELDDSSDSKQKTGYSSNDLEDTVTSKSNIEYPFGELKDMMSPKAKITPKSAKQPPPKTKSMPTVDRSTKPDISVGKPEKTEHSRVFEIERPKPQLHEEPMDEDKGPVVNDLEDNSTPTAAATKGRHQDKDPDAHHAHVSSTPVRPATPPRHHEKSYPTTPKKATDKGEGDGGIFSEKLKYDGISRSGGLKRSASSPNINKLADEDLDAVNESVSPLFDRSTKPKPMLSNYDSPRGAGTDTIYLANNKQGRGLTGLKNLGNLCYMNSIMQCISNTVELTKELTRFNAKESSSRRQIASEVSSLLRVLWQGDTRLTSCRQLKTRVGALRSSFSTMEQQDSHEFLTILMDWLHEDLNEPSQIKSLDGADEETGERSWGEFRKKNNSVVLDLFYGQLKSTVTCNHCQKQSILFEPFSNLSVPLPSPQDTPYDKDRRCSLQDCLKLYLKGETISGWVCPSCRTPREATKKLDITRLPPVLIIHLKRFMSDTVGVGWCRKRMNMVDFPISDFDMKPYTHPNSELRFHNYNLYAVSNHYGSMDSGHYTAYCKNHLLNKWYKFDDHDVNEMSPADVKSSAAYILFYESNQVDINSRIMD